MKTIGSSVGFPTIHTLSMGILRFHPLFKWFAGRLKNLLRWCCSTQGSFKFYPPQNDRRHGDIPLPLGDIPEVSFVFHPNGMATAVEVFSSISAGNKHVAVNLCFDADEVFIKDYLWRSRTLNGYFSEVINQSHEMIRLGKFHFYSNKYSDQWHTCDYIGPMRIKAINKLSNVSKKMEVSESKRVQFKLSHILFSFFCSGTTSYCVEYNVGCAQ